MTPDSVTARLLPWFLAAYFLTLCLAPSMLDGAKAALVLWTLHALWTRALHPRIFLDPACLAVAGFCAVALAASVHGPSTPQEALSILGWLPTLILGIVFARTYPERLQAALLLGAGFLAVYMAVILGLALSGISALGTMTFSPTDLTLTFRNLTRTSLYLALGALFCLHALLTITAPRLRLLALTALPVLLCALVLSGKRMTLAAFMATAALLLLWRKKFLAMGLGLALITGLILGSGLASRFDPRPAQIMSSQGVFERMAVWHAAWELFHEHPLLGTGFKTFKQQAEPLILKWRKNTHHRPGSDHFPERLEDAHHIVMHVLAESGLMGLACMAVLFGAPLATAWRTRQTRPEAAGLAAAVLLVLLHLQLHMHLYATNVHGLVFLLLGFAQGLRVSPRETLCA